MHSITVDRFPVNYRAAQWLARCTCKWERRYHNEASLWEAVDWHCLTFEVESIVLAFTSYQSP